MLSSRDTIVAIATPPGQGSIGIVRVSGDRCNDIYQSIIGAPPKPRIAEYVCFKTSNQEIIDRGIALYFKSPASYTGEDILECHLHGNKIVLGMLLDEIVSLGARPALPGEFTERAFLNDKLDLIQAESVAALIDSHSKKAARSAVQSLSGIFSTQVLNLRATVFEAMSLIEATLNFPEEENVGIDINLVVKTIEHGLDALNVLLKKAEAGRVLDQNPSVVIAGSPNVGKSSIINFLSGNVAAIVSSTPGTTRDIVKERVLLDGNLVTLVDTAGIRASDDEIEQAGISRAYKVLEQADLVLFVCDINLGGDQGFSALKKRLPPEIKLLRLWNKVDLCPAIKPTNLADDIYISAKTGLRMEGLIDLINKNLAVVENEENVIFARQRHIDGLYSVKNTLQKALGCIENNAGMEILAENLRLAHQGFDQLLGKITTDDILGEIFSKFCIGK